MKIAFLTPQMIIGGAETYIITKSRWLVDHGHSVVVVSECGENVKNLPQGVKHIEFKTEVSPASFSKKGYKKYIAALSQILLFENVDIIEAHNTSPAIHTVMSYKTTKIPFIINILNELVYDRNPFLIKLTKKLAPMGLLYVLTKEMLVYIENKVGRELQATILPIPVKGISAEKATHDGRYVLSVCRMATDKMYVKHLIRDFIKLYRASEIPSDYKLLIAGDGELFDQVKAVADTGGGVVKMLGTVVGDELERLYEKAEVYVGTGTTLLLGASCATPCLIPGYSTSSMPYCWGVWAERSQDSNILAVTELQNYPRSTYYDTLSELLSDSQKRIDKGCRAKELFENHYSVERIMEAWEEQYCKIIATFVDREFCKLIEAKSNIASIITIYRPLWRLRKILKIR